MIRRLTFLQANWRCPNAPHLSLGEAGPDGKKLKRTAKTDHQSVYKKIRRGLD
jgi:hypothetical protein